MSFYRFLIWFNKNKFFAVILVRFFLGEIFTYSCFRVLFRCFTELSGFRCFPFFDNKDGNKYKIAKIRLSNSLSVLSYFLIVNYFYQVNKDSLILFVIESKKRH